MTKCPLLDGCLTVLKSDQRQHKTRLIMHGKCADRRVDMIGVIPHGKCRDVEDADTPVSTLEPAEGTEPTAPLSFIGGNKCLNQ